MEYIWGKVVWFLLDVLIFVEYGKVGLIVFDVCDLKERVWKM